jgi:hypothetical protein
MDCNMNLMPMPRGPFLQHQGAHPRNTGVRHLSKLVEKDHQRKVQVLGVFLDGSGALFWFELKGSLQGTWDQ